MNVPFKLWDKNDYNLDYGARFDVHFIFINFIYLFIYFAIIKGLSQMFAQLSVDQFSIQHYALKAQ